MAKSDDEIPFCEYEDRRGTRVQDSGKINMLE